MHLNPAKIKQVMRTMQKSIKQKKDNKMKKKLVLKNAELGLCKQMKVRCNSFCLFKVVWMI